MPLVKGARKMQDPHGALTDLVNAGVNPVLAGMLAIRADNVTPAQRGPRLGEQSPAAMIRLQWVVGKWADLLASVMS